MLPIGDLEVARLLKSAVIHTFPAERVDMVMAIAAAVSAVSAAVFVLLFGGVSFGMISAVIYIGVLAVMGD